VKSATGTNHKNRLDGIPGMKTDRKGVMHAVFSWNGKEYGVLVAV